MEAIKTLGIFVGVVVFSPMIVMIMCIEAYENWKVAKRMREVALVPEGFKEKQTSVWIGSIGRDSIFKVKVPASWSAQDVYRQVATKWWGLEGKSHYWGLNILGSVNPSHKLIGKSERERLIVLDSETEIHKARYEQGYFYPEIGKSLLLVYVFDSVQGQAKRVFTVSGDESVAEVLDTTGVKYGSEVILNGLKANLTCSVTACPNSHKWEYSDMEVAYIIVR